MARVASLTFSSICALARLVLKDLASYGPEKLLLIGFEGPEPEQSKVTSAGGLSEIYPCQSLVYGGLLPESVTVLNLELGTEHLGYSCVKSSS